MQMGAATMEYRLTFKKASLQKLLSLLSQDPGLKISLSHPDFTINIYVNENIEGDFVLGYDMTENESFEGMPYKLPSGLLPDDITEMVNLTYEEVLICYRYGCYLGAIVLCGKIIETVLSALLEAVNKKSSKGLGFNAPLTHLRQVIA